MKKNKKVSIVFLIVLFSIFGIFGYREYQNYQTKEQEEYIKIYTIYNCFSTKEYGKSNPLNSIPLKTFQKNAPPQVEMGGNNGLYIKAMAYTYYTGNTVNYLTIEEKINTGEALEVSEEYSEFVSWVHSSQQKIRIYSGAVIYVGGENGYSLGNPTIDYLKLQEFIETHPEEIRAQMQSYDNEEIISSSV